MQNLVENIKIKKNILFLILGSFTINLTKFKKSKRFNTEKTFNLFI